MFEHLDHVASGLKIINSGKACPEFDFSSIHVENKVNEQYVPLRFSVFSWILTECAGGWFTPGRAHKQFIHCKKGFAPIPFKFPVLF
jgi:hypothetical protein